MEALAAALWPGIFAVLLLAAPMLLVMGACFWCDMPSDKDMPGRWFDA